MSKYSLKSDYYKREFDTLEELAEDVVVSGMDPNYEITENGKGIGQFIIDYIDEQSWEHIKLNSGHINFDVLNVKQYTQWEHTQLHKEQWVIH